ncbi:MAG: GIY-YIG nuclease family protein [Legionellales bacterium]|nr:GIY-YIG nuclease family protein [Legionellales bacterium]
MAKGLVYILTNPSLQGWVKIGYTDNDDIQSRLNSLNSSTAIPLSFRVYATLSVEKAAEVEQSIHTIFDSIDRSLHSIEKLNSGKERVREFFLISPEKAFMIFKEIAKLKNIEKDLVLGVPTDAEIEEEELITRKSRSTFKELGISVGTELTFLKDANVKCSTVDDKNAVKYENQEYSLSALGKKLIGYPVSGFQYFVLDNETLSDRRQRLESLTSSSS